MEFADTSMRHIYRSATDARGARRVFVAQGVFGMQLWNRSLSAAAFIATSSLFACSSPSSGTVPPPSSDTPDAGDEAADAGSSFDSGTAQDAPIDTTGDDVPPGCTLVELGPLQYLPTQTTSPAVVPFDGPLLTSLGDPNILDAYNLAVISQDTSAPTATGSFELGKGVESNFATASHVVVVFEDVKTATTPTRRKYFPVSGTFTIDPSTPPNTVSTNGFKVTLDKVRLTEVTIASGTPSTSTPVPGGRCVYIRKAVLSAAP
jgi:hypothetical protein